MSLMSVYNLTEIPEFVRLLKNTLTTEGVAKVEENNYIHSTNYSTKSNEQYRIVRYHKKM